MASDSSDRASRSSSPLAPAKRLSPRDVLLKTPSPDPASALIFTGAVPSAATIEATIDSKFKTCGENCDRKGCRRMRFSHNRRLVCTEHMPGESYKKCGGQEGCKNVIHADCLEDNDIETWICHSCTAITASMYSETLAGFNPSMREPRFEHTSSR
jgi:hypothetical protein